MTQKKAILTVGLPGSGKSTWAKPFIEHNPEWVRVERDVHRKTVYPNWPDYQPKKAPERQVTELHREQIALAMENGLNVVVSDTNMNPDTRAVLTELFEENGYDVELKLFTDLSLKEVMRRNRLRMATVPEFVIHTMAMNDPDVIPWARKEYNLPSREYVPEGKPPCIIVDMDGTIANMDGIRGPHDYGNVDKDTCHDDVMDLIEAYVRVQSEHVEVIILSGRTDEDGCLDKTEHWLQKNQFHYDGIHMRKKGDQRKDSIFKEEAFWEHVAPYYTPIAVFDDRRQVVEMWRNLGLRVFQIHHPFKRDDF